MWISESPRSYATKQRYVLKKKLYEALLGGIFLPSDLGDTYSILEMAGQKAKSIPYEVIDMYSCLRMLLKAEFKIFKVKSINSWWCPGNGSYENNLAFLIRVFLTYNVDTKHKSPCHYFSLTP